MILLMKNYFCGTFNSEDFKASPFEYFLKIISFIFIDSERFGNRGFMKKSNTENRVNSHYNTKSIKVVI